MNKFYSLLIFCLLFSIYGHAQDFPETEWIDFANTDWFEEGQDHFQIDNAEDLAGLSVLVADGNDFADITIEIMEDIDLNDHLWQPIGIKIDLPFSGNLSGNGHTITNLWVNQPEKDFGGLFGAVLEVHIQDLNISSAYVYARGTVGTLVGNLSTESTVENCHVFSSVVKCEPGMYGGIGGGLVGGLLTKSSIFKSSFSGTVLGGDQIGGLVGTAWDNTLIEECYTEGNVEGDNIAGGVVGYTVFNFPPDPSVTNVLRNSYSRAHVSVTGTLAGGIYGAAEDTGIIENCYTTGTVEGPGDIGAAFGSIGQGSMASHVYFDMETSGLDQGAGTVQTFEEVEIIGLTTEEMKDEDILDHLNNGGEWWIIDSELNDGYPILENNFVLGVDKFELDAINLLLYPTMAENNIHIKADRALEFTLVNLSGKIIDQGKIVEDETIYEVSHLSKGIYMMIFKNQEATTLKRFIKK